MLLNSFSYDLQETIKEQKIRLLGFYQKLSKYADKIRLAVLGFFALLSGWLYATPMFAQDNLTATNTIVEKIFKLIQSFYNDFVYLSLGLLAAVVIYHLLRIILASGDDRERSLHTRAIITAFIAWFVINTFMFIVTKLLDITGGRNILNTNNLTNPTKNMGGETFHDLN